MIRHNPEYQEKAKKAALKALLALSERNKDFCSNSAVYFNSGIIAGMIPDMKKTYGRIYDRDVPELLTPFIDEGLVKRVIITGASNVKSTSHHNLSTGYMANLSERERIIELLKRR